MINFILYNLAHVFLGYKQFPSMIYHFYDLPFLKQASKLLNLSHLRGAGPDQVLLSVGDCWREDQAANVKEYFARTTGLWTIPLCIDWFLACHR